MATSTHKQRVAAYQNAIQDAFFASGAPVRSFKALQEAVESISLVTSDQRLWECVVAVNRNYKVEDSTHNQAQAHSNDLPPLRRVQISENNVGHSTEGDPSGKSFLPSIHKDRPIAKPFLPSSVDSVIKLSSLTSCSPTTASSSTDAGNVSFTRALTLTDFNAILADLVVKLERFYSGFEESNETPNNSTNNHDKKMADAALNALMYTLRNDLFYFTDLSTKTKSRQAGEVSSDDNSDSSDAETVNTVDYHPTSGHKKGQHRKVKSNPSRPTLGPNPFAIKNQQLQQLSRSGTLSNSFFMGGGGNSSLSTNNIRKLLSAGGGKSNLSTDVINQSSLLPQSGGDQSQPAVTAAHLAYFLRHFFLDGDAIVKAMLDKMHLGDRSTNQPIATGQSSVPSSPHRDRNPSTVQTPHHQIEPVTKVSENREPKSEMLQAFEERKNQLLREQNRRAVAYSVKEYETARKQFQSRSMAATLASPSHFPLSPQSLQLQHHTNSQTPSQLSRLRRSSSSHRSPSRNLLDVENATHKSSTTGTTSHVTAPTALSQQQTVESDNGSVTRTNTNSQQQFIFTGFAETDPAASSIMDRSRSALGPDVFVDESNQKPGAKQPQNAGIHFVDNEDTVKQRQSPAMGTGIISLSPSALSIMAATSSLSPQAQPIPQQRQRRQSASVSPGGARRGSQTYLSPQTLASLANHASSTTATAGSPPPPDIATLMARSKHLHRRVSVAANRIDLNTSDGANLPSGKRVASQAAMKKSASDAPSVLSKDGHATAKMFLSRHERSIIIPPDALLDLFYGLFGIRNGNGGESSIDEDLVTPISHAILTSGNGSFAGRRGHGPSMNESAKPGKTLESQSVAELFAYLEHAHETQIRRQEKKQTDFTDYLVNAITTGDLLLRRRNIGRPTLAALQGDAEDDGIVTMDNNVSINEHDRPLIKQTAAVHRSPIRLPNFTSSAQPSMPTQRQGSTNNNLGSSSNNLANLLIAHNANSNGGHSVSAASSMSQNLYNLSATGIVGGMNALVNAQHSTPLFFKDASYLDGSDYDEELDGPPTFTPSGGIILHRRDGGKQDLDDDDNILVSGIGLGHLLEKAPNGDHNDEVNIYNSSPQSLNYKHKTRLLKALVDAGAEGVDVAEVQFLQSQHDKQQVIIRVDAKVNAAAVDRITVAERLTHNNDGGGGAMSSGASTSPTGGDGSPLSNSIKAKKRFTRGGPSSLYPSVSPFLPVPSAKRRFQSKGGQTTNGNSSSPTSTGIESTSKRKQTNDSLLNSSALTTDGGDDQLQQSLGASRNSKLDSQHQHSSAEEDTDESTHKTRHVPPGAQLINGVIVKPHKTFIRNTPMSQLDPWIQTQLRRNHPFISPYPRVDLTELARRQEAIRWISHRRKMEEKYSYLASPERAMGLTQIKVTGTAESQSGFDGGQDDSGGGGAGLSTCAQALPPLSKQEQQELNRLVSEEMARYEAAEKRAEERRQRQREKRKEAFDAAIAANRAANGNSSRLGSRANTPTSKTRRSPDPESQEPMMNLSGTQIGANVAGNNVGDILDSYDLIPQQPTTTDEILVDRLLSDGRNPAELDDEELARQLVAVDVIMDSLEAATVTCVDTDEVDAGKAIEAQVDNRSLRVRESFKMRQDKQQLETEVSARKQLGGLNAARPVGAELGTPPHERSTPKGKPKSTLLPGAIVTAQDMSPTAPIQVFNPRQHFTKPALEEFPNPSQKHNTVGISSGNVVGMGGSSYRKEVGAPRTAMAVQRQLDIDPEFFVQYVKHVAISQGAQPSSVYPSHNQSKNASSELANRKKEPVTKELSFSGKKVTKGTSEKTIICNVNGDISSPAQTVKQRQLEKKRRQEMELIEWALKLRRDGFQV